LYSDQKIKDIFFKIYFTGIAGFFCFEYCELFEKIIA